MIKELCAVLFILCSPFIKNFDFTYSNQEEFARGIAECTVSINAYLPPHMRVVTVISVAQAALESSWGESRFAREGYNFYGIIETDNTEPHIKSLGSNILLKKYGRRCESTADYINVLNRGTHFTEYREMRIKQSITNTVNIDALISTLIPYAKDPFYTFKVRDTVSYLLEHYPNIFLDA